jgi:hypothetical protein
MRIAFQGKSVFVKDIGAGGLSFCNKNFKVGDSQSVTLDLPAEEMMIRVTVEIIEMDQQGVCHCRFTASSHDAINAIHRYMLKVQKHTLRRKKSTERKMSRSEQIGAQARHDPKEPVEEGVKETTELSIPSTLSVD